ncbi:MAG: hypothetical protein O3B24_06820 [Verrucomicrobia bacterium]|nr:hypothetical protein [Verrucomicrobiota bacterium]
MTLSLDIRTLVEGTLFVDTHEYLLEESTRLLPDAPARQWHAVERVAHPA